MEAVVNDGWKLEWKLYTWLYETEFSDICWLSEFYSGWLCYYEKIIT